LILKHNKCDGEQSKAVYFYIQPLLCL